MAFNLQDFLSGAASAAASRGVLKRVPIAYLYNGVQLPGLPVVEGFEYKVMIWDEARILTFLYFSTAKLHKNNVTLTSVLKAEEDGSCIVYTLSADKTVFERAEDFDLTFPQGEPVAWVTGSPRWANYDVLTYGTDTVYLEASEPVPVYE